jgi:hypothetical protein
MLQTIPGRIHENSAKGICYAWHSDKRLEESKMAEQGHSQGERVVAAFRKHLNEAARQQIGDAGFELLSKMIHEAIQQDRKQMADLLEDVIKKLRKEIDTPELGM